MLRQAAAVGRRDSPRPRLGTVLRVPDAIEIYPWQRPLGATPVDDGVVEFRVWALEHDEVLVRVGDREHALAHAGLGVHEARVNSFHHQAVDRLGSGLRAVGWAADGVIEALEATDRSFTVAVQWHAESMIHAPEQARLLTAFAEAAVSYGAGAARAA